MDDSARPIISSLHESASIETSPAGDSVERTSPTVAPHASAPALTQEPAAQGAAERTAAEKVAPVRTPRPNDPMIVFAYDCLRREFAELLARKPVESTAPSADDVHRMRIAMRRLRVALRLFRRILPRAAKDFRRDLRAFARSLGMVRDVDVHAETFRSFAETIPAEGLAELGGYELHLRRERADARNRMSERFGDDCYDELLTAFAAFLDNAPSPGAERRWRSFKVSDGVDKYLKKSLKRVLKLGRKVGAQAHDKDLHRLRIRSKRLRYELEFFAVAYKSLDKAAEEAKALQDLLGAHQDACTAADRLGDYARSLRKHGGEPLPPALARLAESERQRAREVRESFPAEWRRFERSVARGRIAL